jgi:hypothetical protein
LSVLCCQQVTRILCEPICKATIINKPSKNIQRMVLINSIRKSEPVKL